MVYERTNPYDKSQAGFIERRIGSTKMSAQILKHSNPNPDPGLIYGEALKYLFYINNCLPSDDLSRKPPNSFFDFTVFPPNLYIFGTEVAVPKARL